MTYHRVCNYINTMGATSGAEAAYPSGAPVFTPGYSGVRVALWFYVCVLWIVVCPFVPFLLAIALSVLLRYVDSDLPLWYLQTLPSSS